MVREHTSYQDNSQVVEDWLYSQLKYHPNKPNNHNSGVHTPDRRKPHPTVPVWEFLYNFNRYKIYEDDDLLILNKPSGVTSHQGGSHLIGVLEIANYYYGNGMITLSHRLDRNTSGVLVLTKNDAAEQVMDEQFSDKSRHKIDKRYAALLHGEIPGTHGTLYEMPLFIEGRNKVRIAKQQDPIQYIRDSQTIIPNRHQRLTNSQGNPHSDLKVSFWDEYVFKRSSKVSSSISSES